MAKLKKFFKERSVSVARISIILSSILLITYLFPREGKFNLEYAKGEPWKHEDLIAPYNFPIQKSLTEIKKNRDDLLKNFRPYFVFDSLKGVDQLAKIEQEVKLKCESSRFLTANRDSFIEVTQQIVTDIYKKGIILLPEEYSDSDEKLELILIRGSYGEPYGISELLTAKQAYSLLTTNISNAFASKIRREKLSPIIQRLELNRFLIPNIRFDKERTELERSSLLKNLSLTSGGVISGQRIIGKGEIITDNSLPILDSFKKEFELRLGLSAGANLILFGQLLIVSMFVIGIAFFLFFFRNDVYLNVKSVGFIYLLMILVILFAKISKNTIYIPSYIIPFAILPIIIRIFFDSRLAFFVHVNTIILASFFAESSFEFLFLQIPIGVTSIVTLFKMTRRSQLLRAAFFIFLTYSILYIGLSLLQGGELRQIDNSMLGMFLINAALLTLVYPLIYIFERLFGFLSDVTLVELSDTNHPLLRELAENAPGTFQHSIQVGNLAQEAAYKIGANALLVRAGAMYHDIGKSISPGIFTENQVNNFNPLSNIDEKSAAQMVISHIENGVTIARKHKIPEQIIDFITTHQGTGKTKYFFNTYYNEHPNEELDKEAFSYPGPTPFTRETAILMMADSVEAASRSLKNYSPEAIDELVERIIEAQIKDNQFINAPITFKELTEIKEVFKRKLRNIYHSRIEYPTLKK